MVPSHKNKFRKVKELNDAIQLASDTDCNDSSNEISELKQSKTKALTAKSFAAVGKVKQKSDSKREELEFGNIVQERSSWHRAIRPLLHTVQFLKTMFI